MIVERKVGIYHHNPIVGVWDSLTQKLFENKGQLFDDETAIQKVRTPCHLNAAIRENLYGLDTILVLIH